MMIDPGKAEGEADMKSVGKTMQERCFEPKTCLLHEIPISL